MTAKCFVIVMAVLLFVGGCGMVEESGPTGEVTITA